MANAELEQCCWDVLSHRMSVSVLLGTLRTGCKAQHCLQYSELCGTCVLAVLEWACSSPLSWQGLWHSVEQMETQQSQYSALKEELRLWRDPMWGIWLGLCSCSRGWMPTTTACGVHLLWEDLVFLMYLLSGVIVSVVLTHSLISGC